MISSPCLNSRHLQLFSLVTAPIKNAALPAVVPTSPWDGKDGELPVEEDWDLSDVDLDDEPSKEEL